jgi:hypothetical protein
MQTTLTIDDQLFEQAAKLVAVQNPTILVEMALMEFIKHHQVPEKNNLLDLYGVGGIRKDYDYKKLRCAEDNDALG